MRFKDAIIDGESHSPAAGSTEAQHPYCPVKIHASLTRRCLGVSWALQQPGASLSNGTLRDVGLFEDLLEATYPNLHLSKGIRGLISAQREEPARHSHRQRHGGKFRREWWLSPRSSPVLWGQDFGRGH